MSRGGATPDLQLYEGVMMCAPSRPGEVHRSSNAKHRPPPRASKRPTTSKMHSRSTAFWIAHIPTSTKHAPSNHTLFGIPPYEVFVRVIPGDPTYDRACRQKGESPKRECRYTQPWPLVPIGTCIRRSPSRTRPQVPEHAPPRRLWTGRGTRTKST